MPYQLLADVRPREPCAPGQAAGAAYEYTREGTCNLFLTPAPHLGWRQVEVTARRTAFDVAHPLERLDVDFPEAEVIRVVLDDLNVHTLSVFYEVLSPAEA